MTYSNFYGNVLLLKDFTELPKDSVALVHQAIVVDKERLIEKVGKISKQELLKVEEAVDYVLKE